MRGGWKLARVAGIDIFVHWTFLLIVAWVAFAGLSTGQGLPAAATLVAFLLAIFTCVVLHELGHSITAKRFGIQTRDITLWPLGGIARFEKLPDEPWAEVWIALSGPAVNVVIAGLLWAFTSWIGDLGLVLPLQMPEGQAALGFLPTLMVANIVLVLFNLLPAFPMDGGRVLRGLLATRMEYVRATHIAANIGQAAALVFAVVAILNWHLILFLVAIFILFAGKSEARFTEMRWSFKGVPVSRAMVTRYRTLQENDPLRRATELLLEGAQEDFPVLRDGRFRGLLGRQDLLRGLAERGEDAPVRTVMRRGLPTVAESDALDTVFPRLQENSYPALPVLRDDSLVGLLTADNVLELAMIHRAHKQHQGAANDGGRDPFAEPAR